MIHWLPIVVSLVALTISVLSYRQRRVSEKRELFLRVNDTLVSLDMQRGRELLAEVADEDAWWEVRTREVREQINRSLAQFDVMALYVEKKYLDADTVLEIGIFPSSTPGGERCPSSSSVGSVNAARHCGSPSSGSLRAAVAASGSF
jgi:hypothetical protein